MNDIERLIRNPVSGSVPAAEEQPRTPGFPVCSLAEIEQFKEEEWEDELGGRRVRHDPFLKKWRMTIQLDEERIWFLSIFLWENGSLDRYSLDQELVSDSHYEFRDEAGLRQAIYTPGDEKLLLAEVLVHYVQQNGGSALLKALEPFIIARYLYD